MKTEDRSELAVGEPHPMAYAAAHYVTRYLQKNPAVIGALASCAIESNRLGEVCCGTIDRLRKGQPVSDRYILGLAFFLKTLDQTEPINDKLNQKT